MRRRIDGPTWAFAALAAASVPLQVAAARRRWFWTDEWEVILHRDLGDIGSLFRPWWGHCIAIPAAIFRVLVDTFGLGSYLPFLLVGVAGHLASTTAVWVLTRRVGVRGWLATATVAPLLVLGSGRTNIVFAFQITMTMSLALGLVHLVLADHAGGWSRRDTVGVTCSLLALMCSGVVLATLVGVGVVVLLRRGWRLAALHTVPLGLAYASWVTFAPSTQPSSLSVGAGAARFLGDVVASTFDGLGQHPVLAVAIGAVFLVGLAPALLRLRSGPAPRDALVVGVAAAAAAFAVLVSFQRAEVGIETRYVHVLASLVLAVVALGIERLWARWPAVGTAALGLVLVGVPANVALLDDREEGQVVFAAVFRSEHLDAVPGDQRILFLDARTARDLRDRGLAEVPLATVPTPREQLTADGLVVVAQRPVDEPPGCVAVEGTAFRSLAPGAVVVVRGDVDVVLVDGAVRSMPLRFRNFDGAREITSHVPVDVEVSGVDGGTVLDCRAV